MLADRPQICGAVYGVAIYVFMNRMVISLSAIGPQRFVLASFVNSVLIHVFGVGIPSAFAAAARPQSRPQAAPSRLSACRGGTTQTP